MCTYYLKKRKSIYKYCDSAFSVASVTELLGSLRKDEVPSYYQTQERITLSPIRTPNSFPSVTFFFSSLLPCLLITGRAEPSTWVLEVCQSCALPRTSQGGLLLLPSRAPSSRGKCKHLSVWTGGHTPNKSSRDWPLSWVPWIFSQVMEISFPISLSRSWIWYPLCSDLLNFELQA